MAEGKKKRSHWGQNLQRRSFNKARMVNVSDLLLTSNFGKSSKKGTLDNTADNDIVSDASIALTVGLPSDSLIKEEEDFGVVSEFGVVEQINYMKIRNRIIRVWRDDVSKWISKEMFIDIVPKQCRGLLDTAYDFLVLYGYINFGVAPPIKEKILVQPSLAGVIVVGAGLAGLAAARQLMSFGFRVTVLEGRAGAGGRVCTKKWTTCNNKIAAVDLGGSVLHGILGNPLMVLAQQLSLTTRKVSGECPLYGVNGTQVDRYSDSRGTKSFNNLLDKLSKIKKSSGEISEYWSLGAGLKTFLKGLNEEEMRVFNWHVASNEFSNANLVSMLSLAHWDQDDYYEMEGGDCFLHGGNRKLVEALVENVPIHYGKIVDSISYSNDGVLVSVVGEQVYKGDMVVCTVPLGVLKSRTIRFVPELPQRKLDAIRSLGFGVLNKVALLFRYAFWGRDSDSFGRVCDCYSDSGEFFLFYNYANVAGGPVLIALVAGEAAYRFESEDPAESVKKVVRTLRGIFEPKGIMVPEPLRSECTRWGNDPLSCGSFSSVGVGASGEDYDALAQSVGGRLFFAGEATHRFYPATMHGAFLSGFREAGKIVSTLKNKKKTSQAIDTIPDKRERDYILGDLFRHPDVELGCFAILYGCREAKSMAILRFTLSKREEFERLSSIYCLFKKLHSESNQKWESQIYRVISRKLVAELIKVRGGDLGRLKFLLRKLGVNLKGSRRSIESVMDSIKANRMMLTLTGECSRSRRCVRLILS